MKRLPSLLLSLVLSLALLVPVFAADACTEVSYTAFTCGKEMHFTGHYCRNGDKTIRVESADACAVSHLDASAQILTVESTVDGKTSTVSFPFSPPEGSKPPSYYKLIADGAKPTSYRLIARHSSFIFPKTAVKSCRFFALFLRIFLLQFVFNCCILSTVNSK